MNILQTIEKPSIRRIISKFSSDGTPKTATDLPESRHQRREILIPLSGKQRYMLNERIFDFEPGCAGLVDHFISHTPFYTGNDQKLLQLWVFLCDDYVSTSLFKVYTGGKYDIVLHLRLPSEFGKIIEQRWDLLNLQENVTQEMVMDFMRQPIELILDEFFLQLHHPASTLNREKLSDFLKIYIRTNMGRNCSIAELSKISGYSASHLSHTFQKETGNTIRGFIDRVRLDYTRSALNNGSKQKEIAYELGFSSPAAFWNWFRKHK